MSRRTAARVLAAACAVWWAVAFFGLIDLAVPLLRTPGFEQAYLLETGWGLYYTVLVAVPLGALAVRPDAWSPALQLAVAAAALAVPAVLTPEPGQLWPAAGVLISGTVVRALACGRAVPPGGGLAWRGRTGPVASAFVLVATVPAVLYAADMVAAGREARSPLDLTFGVDHWPTQAALALAVVALGAVAAARTDGRRLPAWCAGGTAAWLGAVSAAYPDHPASLGRVVGLAAVLWGVAFAAVASPDGRPRVRSRLPAATDS